MYNIKLAKIFSHKRAISQTLSLLL